LKTFQSAFVEREALRLNDGFTIPIESEPAEVFTSGGGGARFNARGVYVFDAQDDAAAPASRGEPCQEIGARVAGVLIGFLGVLVLLGPWQGLGGPSLLGTLLCLGPGVCYGLAFTYTRRHLTGRPESAVSLAAAQVLLGTITLALVTPFFSSAPGHISLKIWGCILALGALGTGLAYVLSYDVIGRAGATTASLVTYVVPLFATFFGIVLLNEGLTWNEPVGALVIIAGAAVSQGLLRRATVAA
jgi:drug/metabolite transporter (DMT)-like permease